ncbi:MAG: RsmE family RNA methyltransferase [Candidatus Zixiibacteriota bacterium]
MKNITNIFYAPDENFFKDKVHIPQDESHHMIRVLRMDKGDQFVVTNGNGRAENAIILKADPKKTLAEIIDNEEELPPLSDELPVKVAIGIGTIRPKRFERLLSPISQLGINEIIPLICRYSEPSHTKRLASDQYHKRLDKMVRNATKGSLRINFPTLYKPVNFLDALEDWADRRIFFADPEGIPTLPVFKNEKKKDILMIIGPEGGFSHREVETMRDMNAIPISLGRTRLRTENAAIAMMVKTLNGLGMI